MTDATAARASSGETRAFSTFRPNGAFRMLWLVAAAFFGWLVLRELTKGTIARVGYDRPDPTPIDWSYVVVMGTLGAFFAWQPLKYWQLERTLTAKARILAENPKAKVHCNTIFDTWFDQNVFAAGHADPQSGRIVFQHPWCGRLMDQIGSSELTRDGVIAIHILAHEAMHVRGELNEAKTECQAIQRFYRTARLLGLRDQVAAAGGWQYYDVLYAMREQIGGLAGSYHSPLCGPGKEWDERLPDSTWAQPRR